ncbi:MAG TPA: hypothetical protein VHM67_10965 [Gemmatimonadaceae bacterium]|nr:hypothetical protein [Gemmatimonadaceae bacterium]
MARLTLCLTAALGFAAAPLAAQSPACDSVFFPRESGWAQDTLFLGIDGGYGLRPVDEGQAQFTLTLLADSLRLPQPLPLPPIAGRLFGDRAEKKGDRNIHHMSQAFAAEGVILFGTKGELKQVVLTQTSLVPTVDAALLDALKRAAAADVFRPYADAAKGVGGSVFVQLRTLPIPKFGERVSIKDQFEARDRSLIAPPLRSERKMTRGGSATLPLRVLRVPIVAATAAASERKSGPRPAFPQGELDRSFDGTVHVEFVIGADGRVLPGTMRLADATTYGYAAALLRSLERSEWNPAMAGSCPVAQHMAYSYTFEVR